MLSAKSIMVKSINVLSRYRNSSFVLFTITFSLGSITGFSQDNSPYSRYGLGDMTPPTNITLRGLGGISAAYNDILSINFNNKVISNYIIDVFSIILLT